MVDISEIASAAKSFACTLYKNQPGALVPNPISDALHIVWDNFCDYPQSPGLPAKPVPPIQGAQCVCGLYNVRIRFVFDGDTSPGDQLVSGQQDSAFFGPIGATRLVQLPSNPDGTTSTRIDISCRGTIGENCTASSVWRTAVSFVTNYRSHTVTNLGRLDGGLDNCGTLPNRFPEAPPPPVGGYTSPPVNFVLNDGDNITVNFNLKPPLPPVGAITGLPPVIINLVKPTANINIPVAFNFDGSINFGSGGAGLEFNQDDRDTINNINNVANNSNDAITNIQNDINNVTNYNNNKPEPSEDFEPPITNQPPGEYEQAFLGAVTIALTSVPVNAKRQSGDGSPDVIYAGWFEWKKGNWKTPRQPIHFEDNIFLAPKGVDGFAYTLYHGFDGRATSIIYKEKV